MYSGKSCRKIIARRNISTGPMIQLSNKEMLSTFVSLKTFPRFSYFTLAKGGYIIRMRPMARGTLVVPLLKELLKAVLEGIKYPITIPRAIARNIHRVRYRSHKLSFFILLTWTQSLKHILYQF